MAPPPELLVGLLLTVSGVGGVALAYVGYRHRDHPAATPFAVMTGAAGVWGFVEAAMVYVRQPFPARVLFGAVGVAGAFTVAGFFWFVLIYVGRGEWLTPQRKRAGVGLLGLLVALAVADVPLGIFTADVAVRTVDGLTLPVRETTTLFGVYLAVSYLGILAGFWLLGRFLVAHGNVSRKQTGVVLVAFVFAFAGNVVFRAGLSPHPGLDTTPIFYLVETALIGVALFYYDFLDVEPLAPDVVLEEMDDPVVVLDGSDVIVDYNPAARPLFEDDDPVGDPVGDALPGLLAAADEPFVPSEYDVADAGSTGVYDVNEAPISDQYGRERGAVVVLRDVTVQQEREGILDALKWVNQSFLDADTPQEVADIATTAAEEVLGYQYSGVMLYDDADGMLHAASMTDSLERAFERADYGRSDDGDGNRGGDDDVPDPAVGPGPSDLWQVFESGEPNVGGEPLTPSGDRQLPVDLGGSLLFPLGEHGVLGVSADADHDGFSADDRRFARTLASAAETALDRVEKERQLRESRELLERRSEQIEFFNSVLRHDLLNGMMVVQGNVELLEDHVDDAGRDHLSTIDDWTTDITALARKVRRVSRTVTGVDDIELEPVDLAAAIERKAEKIRDTHDGATVEVRVEDDRRVLADDLLPEVVENLLMNAVEHNDTDAPEITVETRAAGDAVRVRVADDGPGVPDGMKSRVFDERVTDDDSGSIGFGLHFVRVMMDLYGGDAWLEDNDPRGTVAVLELPAAGARPTVDG